MFRRRGFFLRLLALLGAFGLVAAACGNGGDDDATIAEDQRVDAQPEAEGSDNGTTGAAGRADIPGRDDADDGDVAAAEDVSLDLMLRSASVEIFNFDDEQDEFVRFCFDEEVQEITDESGFVLQGFDPDNRIASTSVELVEEDPSCLLAGFEAGTDVRSYTLARSRNSAVTNFEGRTNIHDAVPLEGGLATEAGGQTAFPELIEVSQQDTIEQVDYVFDELLDEDESSDASSFGYYTSAGEAITAARAVTVEDNRVTVEFDDDIKDAVRFFVLEGAVRDVQGDESTAGATGGTTAAPDLVGAASVAGSDALWDFTFDEDVKEVSPAGFALYTQDGERFEGQEFAAAEGATVIRVSFDDVEEFPEEIARATVGVDAVTAAEADGITNTVGAVNVGDPSQGGLTAGPDLTGAEFDVEAGQVTFVFDENLDDDLGENGSLDAGRFLVITEAGQAITGREFVEVNGNRAIVLFQQAPTEASGAVSIDGGAVQDEQGNRNPADAVRL
jgi:hypothetical protein